MKFKTRVHIIKKKLIRSYLPLFNFDYLFCVTSTSINDNFVTHGLQ